MSHYNVECIVPVSALYRGMDLLEQRNAGWRQRELTTQRAIAATAVVQALRSGETHHFGARAQTPPDKDRCVTTTVHGLNNRRCSLL